MLYLISKQVYKHKLLKKYKIHNIFHMSLLEQDITKKERVKKVLQLNAGNDSKKSKLKAI